MFRLSRVFGVMEFRKRSTCGDILRLGGRIYGRGWEDDSIDYETGYDRGGPGRGEDCR